MSEGKMTEKIVEIANETIDKADEYFNEFAKVNGKHGYVWLKNDETGQLVVYTRGEYKNQILDFLATLK